MENSGSHRHPNIKKGLIIIGFIVLVILAFIIFLPKLSQPTNLGSCSAPDGYTSISNVMATNLDENPMFVARAIISTGEGTSGGMQVVIPACGSNDPSLQNIAGIFIRLSDGRLAFVANGAVGMETPPLAQVVQP